MRPQSSETLPFLTDDEIKILKGNLESSDASERLRLAFYLLGIDQKHFSEAHTKELKLNYLIYHRVLFEFSIAHPVFRLLAGWVGFHADLPSVATE